MDFLNRIKKFNWAVRIALISVPVLVAVGLLLLPLLVVDAGETAGRSAEHPMLALMNREAATGGIVLLGSVIVLIIVGGTLRVLNQDRLHRPHLLERKTKQAKAEDKE